MMDELLAKLEDLKNPIPVEIEGATIEVVKKTDRGPKGKDGRKGDKGDKGEKGETGPEGRPGKDGVNGLDGKNGKDGEPGLDGLNGKDGFDGKDGSPDMAEDIRNKLELLEGDERLKIEAIKNLREELDKLHKSIIAVRQAPIVSGGGKGHIRPYDLSSQLDGSTKTFNLPANWTVISVVSASFPNAFRPIIDYTFTPTSITFTSQINEGTTLATGQSVIVIYEEA